MCQPWFVKRITPLLVCLALVGAACSNDAPNVSPPPTTSTTTEVPVATTVVSDPSPFGESDPLLQEYEALMAELEAEQARLEQKILESLEAEDDQRLTALFAEKGQNDAAINSLRLQIAQLELFVDE